MTPWLSRELEGLAELALRLIGVFSTLDWERGSQEAKRPFLLGFFPPPWGPGECRIAGAREWHKEAWEAMTWHGGLSILVME